LRTRISSIRVALIFCFIAQASTIRVQKSF